jgi:uncharacterized protein (TIGR03437 family)
MAVVVTTQGRLLTPLEMTLYDRLAAKIQANFASYSGGLGALITSLDFVNSAPLSAKNSANLAAGVPLAPDMIAFGEASGIAPDLLAASTNTWPGVLGAVHLEITDIQGVTRSAALGFVDTGSIGFLVPAGTAVGRATAVLTTSTGASLSSTLDISRISPGLFTANANGSGVPAGFWTRVASDGSQTQNYLFDPAKPVGSRSPTPVDLGAASDQVFLSLYGTGFNHASGASATVGGVQVPVQGFAAAGFYQGLDLVNIGPLPRSLAGGGQVFVMLSFDNQPANTVTVNIR